MELWVSGLCQKDTCYMYEVQSRSNAYIFIVTVQQLLLQPHWWGRNG